MAKNQINTRVQLKHDTEANWNTAGEAGFVPLVGEVIIYDPDALHDYPRIKIGNGSTKVHLLPFIDKALWDQIAASGESGHVVATDPNTKGDITISNANMATAIAENNEF